MGFKPIWGMLALTAMLGSHRTATASPVYGASMANDYIGQPMLQAQYACLYCHADLRGVIVTESVGKAMQTRGLEGADIENFTKLMNALMAELDAISGDPLGPAGQDLLDSDADGVPDALEIRWGANPSDPASGLAAVGQDQYAPVGVEPPPELTYGCGTSIARGKPESGAPVPLALVLGLTGLVIRRRLSGGERTRADKAESAPFARSWRRMTTLC